MSQKSRVISTFASRALSAVLMILFCLGVSSPVFAETKELRAAKTAIQANYHLYGKWALGFNAHPPVHLHVLPDGKVLFWLQLQTAEIQTFARLWDPAFPNTLEDVNYKTVDLFCSGHSLLPDGRLLVTGGTIPEGGVDDGTIKSTIYNYITNTWTDGVDMNAGRWYPTNVALGNGETLVVSGSYKYSNGQHLKNSLPQVWLWPTGGWRNLTNATTSQAFPLYPWMHLLSNGKVFYSGPTQTSMYMTTTGDGSLDPNVPQSPVYRDEGSAVMYDVDKVLVVGGGNPPTNTAHRIDLSGGGTIPPTAPAWTPAASMTHKRRHLNTTILPDGKVLVTGGTSGAGFNNTCPSKYVLPAEVWDPEYNTWTTLASMMYPRLYHSAAVLLPDGRVLVAGTTEWGAEGVEEGGSGNIDCPPLANQYDSEIFSPPYLFNPDGSDAIQPNVTSAPAGVTYGQTFSIGTSGKAARLISKVTLVRLSSTTHSFNQNQRFNKLSHTNSPLVGLSATIPSNPNACPPGYYMLFVINSAGVPSKAKIIKVS